MAPTTVDCGVIEAEVSDRADRFERYSEPVCERVFAMYLSTEICSGLMDVGLVNCVNSNEISITLPLDGSKVTDTWSDDTSQLVMETKEA